MSTKRTKGSGQFSKGTSGNPSGRPPGSRNHATLLMESLLEGQAEQLVQKAIERGLAGDGIALQLCLNRLLPPCRDRPVHLPLPPLDDVQGICSAMSKVAAAIGEGEITPAEGEVLSNILLTHKTILETADLGRRMEALEQRMDKRDSASASGVRTGQAATAGAGITSLTHRLNRLERRLGPQPAPVSRQVTARAWATTFSGEELASFETRWEAAEASGATSLLDIFAAGTSERQEILRRLEPALDQIAQEITGKAYAELLRHESGGQE